MKRFFTLRQRRHLLLHVIFICGTALHSMCQVIDPCSTNKFLDKDGAKKLFSNRGIDLTHYDWLNDNLNCHINLALRKNIQKNTLIGFGVLSVGLGVIAYGIGKLTIDNEESPKDIDIGKALKSSGYVLGAVGITLCGLSFLPKSKSKYHISQVDAFFKK